MEFAVKLIGDRLCGDKNLESIISKAGYKVEVLKRGLTIASHGPLDGLEVSGEYRNVYIVEFLESQKDTLEQIDEIRDLEGPEAAVFLVAASQTPENVIFAQINNIDLLTLGKSPDEFLGELQGCLHKVQQKEQYRRKNLRLVMTFPVMYSDEGYYHKVNAQNLSREGIYLITLDPLEEGRICRVIFSLDGEEKGFDFQARVLYSVHLEDTIVSPEQAGKRKTSVVSHPGMALYFYDASTAEKDRISDYIIRKMYGKG